MADGVWAWDTVSSFFYIVFLTFSNPDPKCNGFSENSVVYSVDSQLITLIMRVLTSPKTHYIVIDDRTYGSLQGGVLYMMINVYTCIVRQIVTTHVVDGHWSMSAGQTGWNREVSWATGWGHCCHSFSLEPSSVHAYSALYRALTQDEV